ncbi:MAG: penicillin-binding transpeptidase domain-containing protein, partial [Thalassolituus sp.]
RQQAANSALQHGLLQYDRDHGYRGARKSFKLTSLTVKDNPVLTDWLKKADTRYDIDWPSTLSDWGEYLRDRGDYGAIAPAIVKSVREDGAWIYTADGFLWLPFTGMEWAAPYLSVNSIGKPPEKAGDVVSPGDLIWFQKDSGTLQLAQLPEAEGALVSINPHNGAIEALVGGFSNADSQFNRATQAERQPGSSFKPFIYSAALDNGYTTATLINDAPVVFEDASLENTWRPENYSGKFYGPTRLRQALYRSQNLVSIRILKQMGPPTAVRYIQQFGFNPAKLNKDLSLALGASAVTPLDVATGYSAFANGGFKISPFVMERIISDTGEVLYKANPAIAEDAPEPDTEIQTSKDESSVPATAPETLSDQAEPTTQYAERIVSKENHFLTVSMMQDVIRRGTGRKAMALGRNDLAGKTGTTNDQKDAWFSGFMPDLVTTVWIGFDQPSTLGRWASGGGTALPVWIDYMEDALIDVPERQFEQPEGIITVRIDPETGLLAAPGQTNAIFEYFKEGTAPTEYARNQVIMPYQ